MKLYELMAMHIEDVDERIASKKLSPRTRNDYVKLRKIVIEADLEDTSVDILGPAHFLHLMRVIESRGYSLRTQHNIITSFRSMFNWAGPEGMNLIIGVVYGPRFCGPSRRAIEAQQEENSPCRFIDRKQILAILDNARAKLRIAILLGINCGFYPGDTIAIHIEHFNMDNNPPYHCFRRVKTLQQRRAVLWPETVGAIHDYYMRGRPSRGSKNLLVNRNGEPYSTKAGVLQREFRKLADAAGVEAGVGIGSLRHTFATIIDTVSDQSMIDLTMGHTNPSIQKRVYRQLNINEFERLSTIANVVRDWLFNREK